MARQPPRRGGDELHAVDRLLEVISALDKILPAEAVVSPPPSQGRGRRRAASAPPTARDVLSSLAEVTAEPAAGGGKALEILQAVVADWLVAQTREATPDADAGGFYERASEHLGKLKAPRRKR